MPAKMMSEMPLPMPRSVICSPSHMMKAVPAVREMTVSRRKPSPGVDDAHAAARPGPRGGADVLEVVGDAEALDDGQDVVRSG
jgi:hypothetical protein